MTDQPDICVIGGGAAGLSVAAGAAQLGASTVLIEQGDMGGDCLNVGCVPSKCLIKSSRLAHEATIWPTFGLGGERPRIEFEGVRRHLRAVIDKIAPNDSEERFRGLGVDVIRNHAQFTDPTTLRVGDRRIKARRFVVATGSRPAIPAIAGLKAANPVTNETVFDLEDVPKHLAVIGGGPIGCELGQAFNRLGSQVTIIEARQLLSKEDPDLTAPLRDQLSNDGIKVREDCSIERVDPREGIILKDSVQSRQFVPTHILVAAGRKPVVQDLGLDRAGIDFSNTGIRVDNRLRTSNRRTFALGDVIGSPLLTHAAGYQAGIVIKNALFRLPSKVDYRALPRVTYTDPEIAQVGLTEAAARAQRIFGDVATAHFGDVDRSMIEHDTRGLIKIVLGKNGRILGAGIAGANAGDLILPWCLAIQQRLKMRAMVDLIAPYPTYSEISKKVASAYFSPRLFSDRTRSLVRFLARFG